MKRTFILGSVVLATVMVVGLLVVLIATGVIGTSSERLLFSSESAEAIYTGEPLTCEEWALKEGTLHEGHTAVATFQGSQTNAGTSENIFTVIIEDENGADVTDDYEIVYQPGTLKVIPCDLHLKADSAAKQYDGTPISATTYQIVGGKLLAGHYLEVTVDGSRTEVGQSDNVLSARVFNKDGEDVTANYNIITAMGDLTVTPHAITIQSGNASKVYDGTALTLDEISMRTGSLISGHNLVLLSTGTLTDAGTVKNTFAVEIQDSEGNNVTHNYTITTLFGELTVSRREMKIQSAPATKV